MANSVTIADGAGTPNQAACYQVGVAPPSTAYGVLQTGIPSGKAKLRNMNASATAVKTSAAILYGLFLYNNSGAIAYVQVFDALAGGVTLGTTVPDMEFELAIGAQLQIPFPDEGVAFTTALTAYSTTAPQGSTGSAAGVSGTALFI